jgi:hypothetical protein
MFGTRSAPDIVPASKVVRLGLVGGQEYVQLDKRDDEYLLEQAVSSPDDLAVIEGQRFVSIPVVISNERGGTMQVGNRYRRALPVARGTYRAELEKAERRAARPQPARLPVDALDGLSLLRPRADSVWPSTGASAQSLLPATSSPGAYVAGRRKVRGRAIVEHLERQGVSLRLHGGKLLVSAAHGRASAVAEVVDKAGRLLLGWLTDRPVLCELDHAGDPPEAWTVLAPAASGLAACEAHATGTAR